MVVVAVVCLLVRLFVCWFVRVFVAVVVVVGDPVCRGDIPVGAAVSRGWKQLSLPVVDRQFFFEGSLRRLFGCCRKWAQFCVPILTVAEEAVCAGRQRLSLPEHKKVSCVV